MNNEEIQTEYITDDMVIQVYDTYIVLDGEKILLPKEKFRNYNSVSVVNGCVWINGYRYNKETNEFEVTFPYRLFLFFGCVLIILITLIISSNETSL